MSKKEKGNCSICGKYTVLTEEHVPPKGAFNKHSYYLNALNLDDPFAEPVKKRLKQGGVRFLTLCAKCNNDTGSWYAKEYIDWCLAGSEILKRSQGKPSLFYISEIYPLRILKQIIVMFFSINEQLLGDMYPYLRKFVLDKYQNNLPPEIDIYAYYNYEGNPRYKNYSVIGSFQSQRKITCITEFSFAPYGFAMTFGNSPSPDERLINITHFSNFEYNRKWNVDLNLSTLQTWLPFPGDYRKKEEIEAEILKSKIQNLKNK